MKLVTFGCSWIYGDELGDLSTEYRNTHNLGYLIYNENRDKFTEYINYGGNGASNERIILQILEYTNSSDYSKDDVIVVGLTSLARKLDYLNFYKFTLTLPSWQDLHLSSLSYGTDQLFRKWFDLTGYFLLNSRNELKRYMVNCLSIKSLIADNPCVVFQSIDNVNSVFNQDDNMDGDGNWNHVILHKYTTKTNTEEAVSSDDFVNKDIHQNELYKNLNNNQLWLNFKMDSWQTFLNKLYSTNTDIKYFASDWNLHPSEIGIEVWYQDVIKKYIDKILDI